MKSEPCMAFIVDALPSIGGGEKTLFAALEVFPKADIFTLIYNEEAFRNSPIANKKIVISPLNDFPLAKKHHRLLLPLMPRAIEQFNLHDYDIVVSFNYAVANGARTNGARHVSYTYTPMRYAWSDLNIDGTHSNRNFIVNQYLHAFRQWDKAAASRVHEIAAISRAISNRIQDAYQLKARVIYPPVEVERFRSDEKRGNYYVTLSRLVAHKRIDLIVEAFSRLRLPLIIIGDGPERKRLQKLAAANIEFVGYQSDERAAQILAEARGFVCAAEEDFGIAIVEAQAAGCPVITYAKGGALETVVEGRSGVFFHEQTTENLINAIQQFEKNLNTFSPHECRKNAERFSKKQFQEEFRKFLLGG